MLKICRTKRFVKQNQCLRYSTHHDDHHGDDHSTGWPKPSGREPLKPYDRQQVNALLDRTGHSLKEDSVVELEGWLFGKKVYYLNSDRPYYEQIPDNHVYLFGQKVVLF